MPTRIEEIYDPLFGRKKIRLFMKRDDLIHPEIPGNKFRKLKYNLEMAAGGGYDTLLTFGGAYSNHIHAVAIAGARQGFNTIGIIRGEEYTPLNPTLADASENGMKLHYVARKQYRNKDQASFLRHLETKYGRFYLIPEGGSNAEAVRGCAELVDEIDLDVDVIAVSCGTGGTMAGILAGLERKKHVIGFPVLKNVESLQEKIMQLAASYDDKEYGNWHLETGYHFGGYARFDMNLVDFINGFKRRTGIPLDPVYTGKMMFGIYNMISKNKFPNGARILAIHTGGLQGIRGFNKMHGSLLK